LSCGEKQSKIYLTSHPAITHINTEDIDLTEPGAEKGRNSGGVDVPIGAPSRSV